MKGWLKRVRGALGMGLTWSALWSGVGALMSVLPGAFPSGYSVPYFIGGFVAQYAILGFLGGATFSAVLGMTEGRHSFAEMSLPRFAAWGACGGFMMWAGSDLIGHALMYALWSVGVPALNWTGAFPGLSFVVLGAGSAAGSLALARTVDDRPMLGAGPDGAEGELPRRAIPNLLASDERAAPSRVRPPAGAGVGSPGS